MKTFVDGGELSFIPESEAEREILKSFMSHVEKDLVDASLDGVALDELVLSPVCDADGSHCRLCGQRLA